MRRILIGGTNSGCGKTTVTCALFSALKRRGLNVAAFKCGPDYIDPMFHRKAIGVASHNLDSFFCDDDTLLSLLDEYGSGADIAVIEGVMGFYDGDRGSAHSVSEITDTPAVIVIDCKGMSDSIGAVMSGFLHYRPNRIAGFIFDRLPEKLISLAKRLCDEIGTEYFGCLPKSDITIESRHLGLVTADEIGDIQTMLGRLGELAEKYICIDKLIESFDRPLPEFKHTDISRFSDAPIIAVARDKAFCFIYQENIDLLEKMGCRIKYFSPLSDKAVPECDGLILCGGYPELYAEHLSANMSMLADVRNNISMGMPTIAECGGFMYLHDELTDGSGSTYAMAGVIKGRAFPTERLQRFGYITMKADSDSLLFGSGEAIRAHEFHYWDSTNCGKDLTAEKADGRTWRCCHTSDTLYAGFPHIYFYSDVKAAARFVEKCIDHGD
ncbi:cobyrinic acid a,c-diamide synthase [Ruminococcus sp. YRD2003]|uniref:cobyrinate a,c-diamide synthase n=1 Tax=Ruminococcus sp. YRD2003 TaxID=1452313 RepID=UPI0008D8CA55|nr:cobyrinic acid a,c-diamide synthase [Ruminococcus flavefaciens]